MITYVDRVDVEDYNRLRAAAGWGTIHPEQALAGLNGSAFAVSAKDSDSGRTVGMARLVWDGGYAALIKDVVVLPEYQGCGIGGEMMGRLMGFLKAQLKPGYAIQADLASAFGKEPFYEKFGFSARPRANRGAGMDAWLAYYCPEL